MRWRLESSEDPLVVDVGQEPLMGLGSGHLHAVFPYAQFGDWVLKKSIPRGPGECCITFHDLASTVTQHGSLDGHRPGQMQGEGGSQCLRRRAGDCDRLMQPSLDVLSDTSVML